jgi:WD40 repeat protein
MDAEASLQRISRRHVVPYAASASSNSYNPHASGRTQSRLMRDSLTDARSAAVRARRRDARAGAVSSASLVDRVYSLDCAFGQQLLAVGTSSYKVHLCDLRSGRASQSLLGHRDAVWSVRWSPFSPFLLATGSADRTARLWDIRRAGCLAVLDQHQGSVVRSPDALSHPTAAENDAATSHNGAVSGVVFTPDGSRVLTTGTDNHMRSWDAETGKCGDVHFSGVRNRAAFSTQLCVSSDSRTVFHPHRALVSAYDIASGDQVGSLHGHHARVTSTTFNPLYEELYTGSDDCQVLVWVPDSDNKEWKLRSSPVAVDGNLEDAAAGGAAAAGASSGDDWDAEFDDL